MHPFYLVQLAHNTNFVGFFLFNSNDQDFTIASNDDGSAYVRHRTTGGIIDFFVFMAGSPDAVIQQYLGVIGKPTLPPFWALGFHQCKWGYQNIQTLKDVVANYSANYLPLDSKLTFIN